MMLLLSCQRIEPLADADVILDDLEREGLHGVAAARRAGGLLLGSPEKVLFCAKDLGRLNEFDRHGGIFGHVTGPDQRQFFFEFNAITLAVTD